MKIACGVTGAVIGFFAGMSVFFLGFEIKHDPIMSGFLALFVFGPAGMVGGAVLGTRLAMVARKEGQRQQSSRDTSQDTRVAQNGTQVADASAVKAAPGNGLAASSLKAIGLVLAIAAVAGTLYYVYAITTATPWLNPNAPNPQLEFEIQLPRGRELPAARDVVIELQTDLNRMPGEVRGEKFRRDGDRPVITGDVELAFRTSHRQLEVKIKGWADRVYPIRLTGKAPHTDAFGAWQSHPDDTSEIRYRAKWPGKP